MHNGGGTIKGRSGISSTFHKFRLHHRLPDNRLPGSHSCITDELPTDELATNRSESPKAG
jgi:hypothetical protein